MPLGIVKRFNDLYGWGFITGDDGRDHFVHYSCMKGTGYKTLEVGDRVEFVTIETYKGPQAHGVIKVQEMPSPAAPSSFRLRNNPFTPQDPVRDPEKFAGRREALGNAIDALFNHKNVLVTGDRGIGKSSIAYQLLFLARGDRALIDRLRIDTGGFKFNYLTADHRCLPMHTLPEVIKGLASSLARSLRKISPQSTRPKELGILSISDAEVHLRPEFVDQFVDLVEETANLGTTKGFNGVCLLLDEIDSLIDEVPLAPFFKATSEKLRLDGFRNVNLVVSGVTGTMTDLVSQHASASRLFENIEIERMEPGELAEIINTALVGTGVTIDGTTRDRIISLSDRFPTPVHLLGYHAFKYDQDDVLDLADLRNAQDYIVRKLKRQEFAELHQGVGESGPILEAMASAEGAELTIREVGDKVGISSQDRAASLMGLLMEKDIIVRAGRKGYYKFREPLFKVYLRWTLNLG